MYWAPVQAISITSTVQINFGLLFERTVESVWLVHMSRGGTFSNAQFCAKCVLIIIGDWKNHNFNIIVHTVRSSSRSNYDTTSPL